MYSDICRYKFNFAPKNVQGEVEFRSVLYIPGMGPLNNDDVVNPKTKNIRLYVKRVFISDDFDGELVSFAESFMSMMSLITCTGNLIRYRLEKIGRKQLLCPNFRREI